MVAKNKDSIYVVGYFPLYYPNPMMQFITEPSQIGSFISSLNIPEHQTMGCIWAYADKCLQPIIICQNAREIAEHMKYYSDQDIAGWFRWYTKSDGDRYILGLMPQPDKIVERFRIRNNYTEDADFSLLFQVLEVNCSASDHHDKFMQQSRRKSVRFSLIDYEHAHQYKTLEEVKDEHIFVLGDIPYADEVTKKYLKSRGVQEQFYEVKEGISLANKTSRPLSIVSFPQKVTKRKEEPPLEMVYVVTNKEDCILGPYVRQFFNSDNREIIVYRHPLGYSTAYRTDVRFVGESQLKKVLK